MMLKRKTKIGITIAVSLLLLLTFAFFLYVSDYYTADELAKEILSSNSTRIETIDKVTVITAVPPVNPPVGLIFYPGGKVEASAYAPLLNSLSMNGITCFLVTMPFNLAVFNPNAADDVIKDNPYIKRWFIAGHSLGGAMASSYVENQTDIIDGLILLGAYPVNEADIPTLAIYGSEDIKLDLSKLEKTENVIKIMGGNHAYFGNYGLQAGDGIATITQNEQQQIAVSSIMDFINQSGQ